MARAGTARIGKADGNPVGIAVEGTIGVGKTTLAKALAAHLGAVGLYEDSIVNPFLEDFYRNKARWGLLCQLCFLEGRLSQFAAARPAGIGVVSDHSLAKDPIFARANLTGAELELYERLFTHLAPTCAWTPTVTVLLDADLEDVRTRIRARGRTYEEGIGMTYLATLSQGWKDRVDQAAVRRERMVVVAADGRGIAGDAAAVARLAEHCLRAPVGVSYCNPQA